MGKLKKRKIGQTHRSDPLSQQILENGTVKTSTRIKRRNRQEENEEFVSDKLSKKILEQAREQQEELEEEYRIGHGLDKRSLCQSGLLDHPSLELGDTMNDNLIPLAEVLISDQLSKKNIEQESYHPDIKKELSYSPTNRISPGIQGSSHSEDKMAMNLSLLLSDILISDQLSKKNIEQESYQQDIKKELSYSPRNRISPGIQGSSHSEDKMAMNVSHLPSDIEVKEEDEKALEQFMNEDESVRVTLGEVIKEKLTEKETEIQTQFSDAGSLKIQNLDKLIPIYQDVGKVLAHYRSGKLPKAFKSIPRFQNWEEVLYLTEPDNWSSAAMYQATRIFASNLKEKMAQRFYNRILLPRLRDELEQCRILNFHLYEALKKSLFKPGAFFKGIILPLCESGTCTLKDATIIGSVIAKFSIPVLHASVAIIKISEMDYSGANSLFLRILLEKKYALPFRTIDAVVAHFLRFALDKRELPLLWHQCLLSFAQLYKNDISSEQQDCLFSLLTVHCHPHVTPEIRRELESAKFRRSTPKQNEENCEQMCEM